MWQGRLDRVQIIKCVSQKAQLKKKKKAQLSGYISTANPNKYITKFKRINTSQNLRG